MNNSNCANCEAYWAAKDGDINAMMYLESGCPNCYLPCGEDYDY